MTNFLNTDREIERYDEAELYASTAKPEMFPNIRSKFNIDTGHTDLLAPLPSGGFVTLASNAPDIMVEAPAMPGMGADAALPVEDDEFQLQSIRNYAASGANISSRDDYLAAGYTDQQIDASGVMGETQQKTGRTEPLSTTEIEGILSEGGSVFQDYDPTMRENGAAALTETLIELRVDERRKELLEQYAKPDASEAETEALNVEISRIIASEQPEMRSLSENLADAVFGNKNVLGTGVGDFVTAGVMDMQEGWRMYTDALRNDSPANRALGVLLMAAGVAEATGVGMVLGKTIKKSIPMMQRAMVSAGQNAELRMAERGPAVDFLSSTMMSGVDPTIVTDPLVAAAGRAVSVPPPIKRNPIVDDLPMVDPDSLVGMKIFPIQADLTKAGGEYTGIDSSLIDVPIALQGGPDYPLLETSRAGNVVWANDAKGVSSKKLNKDTEYALVVAMSPDSHKTNATVNRAMLDTTLAYVRDGRLSDEAISQIDAAIQAPSTQKQLSRMGSFPGLKSPDAVDWINSATFEERNRIMQVMSSPGVQDLGAPNLQKILDATADPRYVGLNSNDSIMLIEIDKSGGAVKLGEAENTVPHLSYEYGLKGKPVARVPFTAAQNMFPEWFADRAVQEAEMMRTGISGSGDPLTLQGSKDVIGPRQPRRPNTARSFQFNLPIERITQSAANNMKAVAMQKVKSPLQAKLLVNALDGAWQTTAQSKNSGGITGLDWVKEAKASPDSATLTIPTGDNKAAAKALDQEIKSGQLTLYKLRDSRTYFGINKNYNYYDEYGLGPDADYWTPNPNGPTLNENETALVSVVSNDFGAKGVGATTVMKAIEEGATVLDAFAVNSDKYPSGFLPAFYARFGFKEAGRIRFDPSKVLEEPGGKLKLQDMKAAWAKKGWKEGDGYPDIVVMKWTGDEGGRSQYTRRFIAEATDGSGQGKAAGLFRPTARSDGSNAGGSPTGQARPGDGNGTAGNVRNDNRGSSASQLADIGREILNATDAQLKNLGIDPQRVRRLRSEMALD